MKLRGIASRAVLSVALVVAFAPSAAYIGASTGADAVFVQQAQAAVSKTKWSAKVAPNYVKVVGKAKVGTKPKKGKIKYSKLDSKGRTRTAVGTITYKLVTDSAGWREEMADDADPSGWGHNDRASIKLYNGRTYNGYFWNRSHLIADSLGGHAIRRNLVTGTRMQNVGANDGAGGMAYCETKVRNWLYAHIGGTVYYRAKPVYKGKELVPRSVVVDMKSSDGTINQRVVVYNAAKGYKVNYKKGTFKRKSSSASASKKSKAKKKSSKKYVYITPYGKKYHLSKSCRTLANSSTIIKVKKSKVGSRTKCKVCG